MSALNPETCGLALAPLACKTVFTPRLQGTWGFHQPSLTPLFLRVSAPCPAPGPALGEAGRWGGAGNCGGRLGLPQSLLPLLRLVQSPGPVL